MATLGSTRYANVVSTLALFVALSGAGAYAAGELAPKSVGERELRHGAVTAPKLRKNAVTAPKIEALAVKQGKLANGAVSAAKLANGAVGVEELVPGAVITDKLANGAVTGEKVDESSLGQVPSAAKADFATGAESANPIAFARVTSEAGVDASFSKGIGPADVAQGKQPGIYCISVPGLDPRGAQVTPEYNGDGDVSAFAKVGGTVSCPTPRVEVQVWKEGALTKSAFYVALYR